jgi:DNA-binding NtrC family response regulator
MANSVKILIVDDEINVLRSLARLFMDCDFEVTTSSSPFEAQQLFETKGPFDIVLSDYMMPVMNGIELLSMFHSKWPNTVGIILSGHADMAQITKAITDGRIKHFVTKPWDDESLLELMENESLSIGISYGI